MPRKKSETPRPPTVAAYFEAKLGREFELPEGYDAKHVSSPTHPDFHIETGCGVECKAAIDAAAGLQAHVRKAYGEHRPEMLIEIAMLTNEVVNCYVYG